MSTPKQHKPRSDLQALRSLAPNRPLTWTEEQAVAARQANRLRQRHGLTNTPTFDDDIIVNQPRLRAETDLFMTMAGSSHWAGGHWKILVNALDHPYRQRFTLAHEYKHIIDHGRSINPDFEERICDYFAACLLMPKRLVIGAWTRGHVERNIVAMADTFGVSRPAMSYRLSQLGLLPPPPRCGNTVHSETGRTERRNRPTRFASAHYVEPTAKLLERRP